VDTLGRCLVALALTVVLEGGVAFLFGLRERRLLLAVVMINVLTNITLNYLLLVLGYLRIPAPIALIVALEAGVVLVEWRLMVYAFRMPAGRLLLLSVAANALSFSAGLLPFWG
jgi:hypothetical protein